MVYTTEELVKAELGGFTLGTTTTPSSDDVSSWIVQAKAEIDARTGDTFEPTVFTQEVYDWGSEDNILRLKYPNIVSITSFEYNSEAAGETPVWVSKTEDTDFFVYNDYGEVEFVTRKFSPLRGKNRFRVSGIYGLSEVPKKIQLLATKIVAKRVIDSVINAQAAVKGGNVSIGTISVTDPSNFSPSVSLGLKTEIDSLMGSLIGNFKVYRPIREY